MRAGGIYIRDNFTPVSDDFTTPGRTDQGTGIASVNGQTGSKQFHNRTTVDASITHSASDFLKGSHDFKFGVQTAYATQRTVSVQFDNVLFTDLNGAPYTATFSDPSASGGRIRSAGSYLQDNWTVNDRVTLNLGVRYDRLMGDIPALSAGADTRRHPGRRVLRGPRQHDLSGGRGSDRDHHVVAARRPHLPRSIVRARPC